MTYRAMGVFGEVSLGTGSWCGSVASSQTALKALGFYMGDVDGIVGPKTQAAMAGYALSKGIPYDPTNPNGPICVSLAADYAAYSKGSTSPPAGAGTCPTGTYGIPPWCVGMPQQTQGPTVSGCPAGTIGLPGMCFPVPAGTLPPVTPPGIPPVSPQGIPNPPGPGGTPPSMPSMPSLPSGEPAPPPAKPGLAAMWAALSTPGKIAVAGAGALLAVALLGAVAGKKKRPMTPNRRRRRRRARKNLRTFMRRRYAKAGVMTVGRGRRRHRFGHLIPPKRYRRKGATRKSQYAWPSGYAYPIDRKKHVRAALSRFSRYKRDYPPAVRRTIARRLNIAKRRFGIGGDRVRP